MADGSRSLEALLNSADDTAYAMLNHRSQQLILASQRYNLAKARRLFVDHPEAERWRLHDLTDPLRRWLKLELLEWRLSPLETLLAR